MWKSGPESRERWGQATPWRWRLVACGGAAGRRGDEPHATRITATTTPSRHPGPRGRYSMLPVMTIGVLSRRTGVSVKTLREYEGMGLIYTVGRSPETTVSSGRSALVHRDGGRFPGPRPDAGRDPRAGGGLSPAIGRAHRAEAG